MRIRGTKPEFWKSKRISSVSWDARLVLKGLESYVDDNGVGVDDIELIVSDVFPRDMFSNPRETVARVSEAISQLHRAGLVHRYTARGESLLYIAFWESTQRIDKPGKGRNPRPDGTFEYKESEIRESVARYPEVVAPVTEEQGNRGTGEQRAVVPLRNYSHQQVENLSQKDRVSLGSKIVNAFTASTSETTWPSKILNELTVQVTACLQDGITPNHIARGLELWNETAYPPSTLANSIREAQREATGQTTHSTPRPRRATGSQRAAATLELADRYAEEEGNR